jgi:hypothetical protein
LYSARGTGDKYVDISSFFREKLRDYVVQSWKNYLTWKETGIVGQLDLKDVKVDCFFSEIDARSKQLRIGLPKIIDEMGRQKIEFTEYDFLSPNGQRMAKAYGVTTVPTVIINAEKLLDPDEKGLRQEIEKAFAARVEPMSNPEFLPDALLKPNVQVLARINP